MRKQVKGKIFASVCAGITLALLLTAASKASDPRIYDNLMRSRDALLNQRQYLQNALDSLTKQQQEIDDKIGRLRDYLGQNDQALRDVNGALRQAGY